MTNDPPGRLQVRTKLQATPCLYWPPGPVNELRRGVLITLNESSLMVIDAITRQRIPGGHIDALPVILD